MSNIRYPKSLSELDVNVLESLKVEVITVKNNSLQRIVCANMREFEQNFNREDFVGPFKSKLNDELTLRFESADACELLSQ